MKKTQQLAFLSASLAHSSLWEEGSFVENSPVKRLTVWRCSPLPTPLEGASEHVLQSLSQGQGP